MWTTKVNEHTFQKRMELTHFTNLHLFMLHIVGQIPNKKSLRPSSLTLVAGRSFWLQQKDKTDCPTSIEDERTNFKENSVDRRIILHFELVLLQIALAQQRFPVD